MISINGFQCHNVESKLLRGIMLENKTVIETLRFLLTQLCPGKDYLADFYNFLHMNPSDDQRKKISYLRTCGHKWVNAIFKILNSNIPILPQA